MEYSVRGKQFGLSAKSKLIETRMFSDSGTQNYKIKAVVSCTPDFKVIAPRVAKLVDDYFKV